MISLRISAASCLVRLLLCASVLLSGSLLMGAVTEVTLNASAIPSVADPVATSVAVVGHGFPTGTIPPANVTVTLDPATAGAGPSGTTTATKVTVISGTQERVTFVVPSSIKVAAPTLYKVSIAGTTSTGKAFASSNTSSLTVNAPVTITTASPLPTGTAAQNYSQTLTATGGSGTYTWAVSSGTLPSPLSLNPTTGVISGQPAAAGTSNFTIKVTDSLNLPASKAFTLTIDPALVITTSSPLPSGDVGMNYSQTLTATGGSGQYTWSVSAGTLPGGLSLNPATGLISGEPTPAGTANFTIEVTDSNQATATKAFALTINSQLEIITTSPLPSGMVGANYSQTVKAIGGSTPYTWAVSQGSLPGGLSLNASTGLISGTPTTAGAPKFGIQVTDSNHDTVAKAFAVTIYAPLLITTTSPLPAGTVTVPYSQTFAASGGAGGYTWSATGLPSWLTLTTAGALTGTPPVTAVDLAFTVKVTDSAGNSTSGSFTLPLTLAITTASPLPTGQVGVSYSQTVTAVGGTGQYTWSVSLGSLPSPLTLNATTGLISGQPGTATSASFTIQVTDSNQVTASTPFTLTVNPAASLQTLSPNSANAGLTLQVSITGSYTHFVQGTTVASFGPNVAVGGAAAGQPGPVIVDSSTSATASITINSLATVGSQTVTVTTGAEQASLANGFSVAAAIPYITVTTTTTVPLAQGFSGFDDEYLINGVEYWDPKYLPYVEALKPGWVRYPSGAPSMAFNWQTGFENAAWMAELEPEIPSFVYSGLEKGQQLTQAKCGACFYGGTCVSDYATFIKTLGANGVVDFNGYTDTNNNSAGKMVADAQTAGMNIIEWELANEPYVYDKIYPNAADYLNAQYNPYYLNMAAADPSVTAGVFYQGQFNWQQGNYVTWDDGMAAYTPVYWQGVSFHVYPISNSSMTTTDEEMTLNGVLAHGTTEWYSSYIEPLIGTSMPIYFTEMNSDGFATMPFETSIYNGIYLAEWIARMSTVPQIKAVGVTELYLGNSFDQGILRAVDDYEAYLQAQYRANPNVCLNTATDPNTQFSFYYSTSALALEIANTAINSSNATWPTTLTGGPTVPILGYDGNPVPAVFAQGYQGSNGTHYVLITNKSNASVPVAIEVNGTLLEETVTVSYISNSSDLAENTATDQNNVQIVTTSSPNPITVGPYSVTRVQW